MGLYRVLMDFEIKDMHPNSSGTADYGVTQGILTLIHDNIGGSELPVHKNANYHGLTIPRLQKASWVSYVCNPKHPTTHCNMGTAIHPLLRKC